MTPDGRRRVDRGVLDTSVIIDLASIPTEALPIEGAISTLTLAELAAGPHVASDSRERAERQDRLQRAEAGFEALVFGPEAARAYGRIYAAAAARGRRGRRRQVDLMIAATAASAGIPLFTRNPEDVAGLEGLVAIIAV